MFPTGSVGSKKKNTITLLLKEYLIFQPKLTVNWSAHSNGVQINMDTNKF